MPAENGSVTPSVAAVATAASTALPPWRSTARPACVASGSTEATAPPRPTAVACLAVCRLAAGAAAAAGATSPTVTSGASASRASREPRIGTSGWTGSGVRRPYPDKRSATRPVDHSPGPVEQGTAVAGGIEPVHPRVAAEPGLLPPGEAPGRAHRVVTGRGLTEVAGEVPQHLRVTQRPARGRPLPQP